MVFIIMFRYGELFFADVFPPLPQGERARGATQNKSWKNGPLAGVSISSKVYKKIGLARPRILNLNCFYLIAPRIPPAPLLDGVG